MNLKGEKGKRKRSRNSMGGGEGENKKKDKLINMTLPGTDVPRATKVMAVTVSFSPTVQPKWAATSPTSAVNTPIRMIETKKHAQPPQYSRSGRKSEDSSNRGRVEIFSFMLSACCTKTHSLLILGLIQIIKT
jgi:hypothetical protein